MTSEDLAELYARAVPDPAGWGAEDFRAVLRSPGAFLTSRPHAFALGRVAADEAELILIATDPGHRRRGLARQCLDQFHREAALRGATSAFLEVSEANAAARMLYDGAGYARVGQRKAYYTTPDGNSQTALILRLDLTAPAKSAPTPSRDATNPSNKH